MCMIHIDEYGTVIVGSPRKKSSLEISATRMRPLDGWLALAKLRHCCTMRRLEHDFGVSSRASNGLIRDWLSEARTMWV